jgi:hypothetical protein
LSGRSIKELYDYCLVNKKLSFKDYWNDIKTIEVNFTYPVVEVEEETQATLF